MADGDKELVALFGGLDTPSVRTRWTSSACRTMLRYRPPRRLHADGGRPAFTVKYVPATTPPRTVGDFIDDVAEGDVVVIDNDGRTDCTVWGDIMTQYAGARRFAGTVIDGVCPRCGQGARRRLPDVHRGRFMRTGKDRVQVGGGERHHLHRSSSRRPTRHRRVRCKRRDRGAAGTRPRGRQTRPEIEGVEHQIREEIARGKSLKEAREALGYHNLQRSADHYRIAARTSRACACGGSPPGAARTARIRPYSIRRFATSALGQRPLWPPAC